MTVSHPLPPHHLLPGQILHERYEIQGVLHTGDMSAVYEARDLESPDGERVCAVKEIYCLIPDEAGRGDAIRNFTRQADVLATLSHPAIPGIYDSFSEEGVAYLIFEFIRGRDLESMLKSSEDFVPVWQVWEWAIALCDALSTLHSQRPEPIIFRDLRPSHIMVSGRFADMVHLLDFGLTRTFQTGFRQGVIATDGYSPPEQYQGQVSPRCDIYALGATLHHILTRQDPCHEPRFSWKERPIRWYNADVPASFAAIVERALADAPEARFATAADMKRALLASGGSPRGSATGQEVVNALARDPSLASTAEMLDLLVVVLNKAISERDLSDEERASLYQTLATRDSDADIRVWSNYLPMFSASMMANMILDPLAAPLAEAISPFEILDRQSEPERTHALFDIILEAAKRDGITLDVRKAWELLNKGAHRKAYDAGIEKLGQEMQFAERKGQVVEAERLRAERLRKVLAVMAPGRAADS